jgi:hypothetical protein
MTDVTEYKSSLHPCTLVKREIIYTNRGEYTCTQCHTDNLGIIYTCQNICQYPPSIWLCYICLSISTPIITTIEEKENISSNSNAFSPIRIEDDTKEYKCSLTPLSLDKYTRTDVECDFCSRTPRTNYAKYRCKDLRLNVGVCEDCFSSNKGREVKKRKPKTETTVAVNKVKRTRNKKSATIVPCIDGFDNKPDTELDDKFTTETLDEKVWIEDDIAKQYLCCICQDVYWKDPISHDKCGNIFHKECFEKGNKKCPVCRAAAVATAVPKIITNILDSIIVKCKLCNVKMKKENYDKHYMKDCKLPCKYKCNALLYDGEVKRNEHYIKECTLLPRKCVANTYGCLVQLPILELKTHETDCLYMQKVNHNKLLIEIEKKIKDYELELETKQVANLKVNDKVDARFMGFWWQARVTELNLKDKDYQVKVRALHFSTDEYLLHGWVKADAIAPLKKHTVGPRGQQLEANRAKWRELCPVKVTSRAMNHDYSGSEDEYEQQLEDSLVGIDNNNNTEREWKVESALNQQIEFEKDGLWRQGVLKGIEGDIAKIQYDTIIEVHRSKCAKKGTHTNEAGNNKWRRNDDVMYKGKRYYIKDRIPPSFAKWTIREYGEYDDETAHEDEIIAMLPIERSLFIDYLFPEITIAQLKEETKQMEYKVGDWVDAYYDNEPITYNLGQIIEVRALGYTVQFFGMNPSRNRIILKQESKVFPAGRLSKWLNADEARKRAGIIQHYYNIAPHV